MTRPQWVRETLLGGTKSKYREERAKWSGEVGSLPDGAVSINTVEALRMRPGVVRAEKGEVNGLDQEEPCKSWSRLWTGFWEQWGAVTEGFRILSLPIVERMKWAWSRASRSNFVLSGHPRVRAQGREPFSSHLTGSILENQNQGWQELSPQHPTPHTLMLCLLLPL